MDKNSKLGREDLKNISGGTAEQMAEFKAFINTHDPEYQINDDFDIVFWLATKSGLGLGSSMMGNVDNNVYSLSNGEVVDHATVMSMLNERFSG